MPIHFEPAMEVPFFRPDVGEAEIAEVVDTLRSGWLTSGPKVVRFQEAFAQAVGAAHAVATNSCTAALHLAVEALGLARGEAVLVPTMTFAATAEAVAYQGGVPLLVDCDPVTLGLDLAHAERRLLQSERTVRGLISVHVGGWMLDPEPLRSFARRHGLWLLEDAAHAFPAAIRSHSKAPWRRAGEASADVSAFSFYANKTITTGEGGMAVTDDPALAERMALMARHGLSKSSWGRHDGSAGWDYRIVAPGYKYNLTDLAAAIGLHQLARAQEMRQRREDLAHAYLERLADLEAIELPPRSADRIHSWHLFPIRLRLDRLDIDRDGFVAELAKSGIGFSVHWRPLHLHPFWQETLGDLSLELRCATSLWVRLVSLPIFPAMTDAEHQAVVVAVTEICRRHAH